MRKQAGERQLPDMDLDDLIIFIVSNQLLIKIKMKSHLASVIVSFAILFLGIPHIIAQGREDIPFNDNWIFQGQSVSGLPVDEIVSLPHSWNRFDAQEGIQYYRGTGKYVKSFETMNSWSGRRVFIRFEGVNITAKVVLNGHKIGEHKGGYAAFCFELTEYLLTDQKNSIEVTVSNEANLEVIPLVGDFNNYGGIYRPVNLIVTEPVCITPLDYASPGIYITQGNVSRETAEVEIMAKMSNGTGKDVAIVYKTSIIDASGEEVERQESRYTLPAENSELVHKYMLKDPHLWNGKKDPYLYQVQVDILMNGFIIDSKIQPLGLRYFHLDADEGFYLNGDPIDLRGVSRHQDRKDKASAISDADHQEDMDLMLEMGINAIRLAH
jgi:beta-galactosidase